MNRIEQKFADLRQDKKKGLVGYLTAGDPDLKQSEDNIRIALSEGIDLLELGVPFSDPTADGPTIQAAAQRALEAGTTLKSVLEMVARLRVDFDTPIILFGYANIFFQYGYELLCADASEAGVDGILAVDLPFEESAELCSYMDKHDLCFVPLIAPTTPKTRMAEILKRARGFAYYVMVTGVTGTRERVVADLNEHLSDMRTATDLPVAVGFGISSGKQAREAVAEADAVVVGSALVEAARNGSLKDLVMDLRTSLDKGFKI